MSERAARRVTTSTAKRKTSTYGMSPNNAPALTWDIWIRLFHWSLVLAVGFQILSGLTGFQFYDWHGNIGEFVLALVVFRLMWGLVGSRNASLSSLFTGPRAVFSHLAHLLRRDVPAERGHNAAGGWAVLAMLAIVGVQAVTGLFIADEDEFIEGAYYGDVSSGAAALLYRVHKINANLLQTIVVLHIAMIAAYGFWGRRNLVAPMITGREKDAMTGVEEEGDGVAGADPAFAVLGKGIACAAVAATVVGLTVGWF